MKNYIIIALSCILTSAVAQVKPTTVESKITAVTVYLSGAQVSRFAQPELQKGENTLVLQGLPDGITPNSIQVSAPSDVILHTVKQEVNYLTGLRQPKRVAELADSLEQIRDQVSLHNSEILVLEYERQMLIANQSLRGEQSGVDVAELEKTALFFRTRLTDIADRANKIGKKVKDLQNRELKIRQQLNELNAQFNRPSNDIVIKLQSPVAKQIDLEVKYLVGQANWVPGYDVRAKDTQSTIRLDYRADVTQQTGEDWNNVKLTLSTGNPSRGASAPELTPWNLYLREPIVYSRAPAPSQAQKTESAKTLSVDEAPSVARGGNYDFEEANLTLADYTSVSEGNTNVSFNIMLPQSIKSGEQAQQVSVQSTDLSASYKHFSVPKLDLEAFLTAGVTGWEKLNLLPGMARIFFEGTYVSEAMLDPALTDDTLSLSLGRDPKLVVSRLMLKDFTKVRMIGLNREKTTAMEIKIRNTKSTVTTLQLEDQIPVSMDDDIVVKPEELSGGKLNAETGKITWDLILQPGESKSIRLIYSVKHPKNKSVPGI
jgi:uncharacterized protein (TIGR02231 family)